MTSNESISFMFPHPYYKTHFKELALQNTQNYLFYLNDIKINH